MKSRIEKTLATLKEKKQKAFIPYITAGYPNLQTTEKLIYTLEQAGATLIELGVPFSDPMADGPVIQRANEQALQRGVNLSQILSLVTRVRERSEIPILLMGYYNPILKYGLKRFVADCAKAQVDGLLVVDLPPEESGPLKGLLKKYPIDLIFLLAPTSDQTRIDLVKKSASGFVYYVSLAGTTGASHLNLTNISGKIRRIKDSIDLPVNVGFGISTPDQVKKISQLADGVIVGSAIVKLIGECSSEKEILKKVGAYVRQLIVAL